MCENLMFFFCCYACQFLSGQNKKKHVFVKEIKIREIKTSQNNHVIVETRANGFSFLWKLIFFCIVCAFWRKEKLALVALCWSFYWLFCGKLIGNIYRVTHECRVYCFFFFRWFRAAMVLATNTAANANNVFRLGVGH